MLAAGGEEALQQIRGTRLANAAIHLGRMMAGRACKETNAMLDGAALGIARAEIKPPDAGEGDRCRAHGARLERHIEVASGEAFAAELRASRPDRDELGMGGGIGKSERPVAG